MPLAKMAAQYVQGLVDDGKAVDGFPVWVGGWDGATLHGFKTDGVGNLGTFPASGSVFTVQGGSAPGTPPTLNPVPIGGTRQDSSNVDRIFAIVPNSDAVQQASLVGLAVGTFPYAFTGGSTLNFDRVRIANVFKTVATAAAGATAIWTPAAGKKFRLLGYYIEITNNATLGVAAVITVKFQDAAADLTVQHSIFIPAAAGAVVAGYTTGQIQLGNGVLSAAANNALNINLSSALTAGTLRVNAWGTEE